MMDCITEPLSDVYPVFVGAKHATYGKDQAVAIGKYTTLLVVQNGAFVGTVKNDYKDEKRVTLADKEFSGLKKGLFAKEYKDVALYWFHQMSVNIFFNNSSALSAKKKRGSYSFHLQGDLDTVQFAKFTSMLKGLKVDPGKNTVILSKSQMNDVIKKRVEEVLPVFLDNCPLCNFNPPNKNLPQPTMILNEVAKVAEMFGLSGRMNIMGRLV